MIRMYNYFAIGATTTICPADGPHVRASARLTPAASTIANNMIKLQWTTAFTINIYLPAII